MAKFPACLLRSWLETPRSWEMSQSAIHMNTCIENVTKGFRGNTRSRKLSEPHQPGSYEEALRGAFSQGQHFCEYRSYKPPLYDPTVPIPSPLPIRAPQDTVSRPFSLTLPTELFQYSSVGDTVFVPAGTTVWLPV